MKPNFHRFLAVYAGGFAALIALATVLEGLGFGKSWIGYLFLMATVVSYAVIGMYSRTHDLTHYHVAGRQVPALYNGMAVAADWMSLASFISLAGVLFVAGYEALAYVMGWTGGFCLLAIFLAPYLRRFAGFTLPDFLAARYPNAQGTSKAIRIAAAILAIFCSFIYLVAQLYGVGLIATRMTGMVFELAIYMALATILVCSFLGGMRAITWTQVAQYLVLIVAYVVPVVWLSVLQTGNPLAQVAYGQQLPKIQAIELRLAADPKEQEVIQLQHLAKPSQSSTSASAKVADPKPQVEKSAGGDDGLQQGVSQRNFLALVFCLTLGTAALPHVLMRFYTTTTVSAARRSVAWALLFILLLYLTAPALATFAKYELYTHLVGTSFDALPDWIARWSRVDKSLLSLSDVNHDGIVQWAELHISSDIITLALPEIGGLPYVVSGMVAAGALAAALSTADGLLLTISNALSHDLYHKVWDEHAGAAKRVMLSKTLLMLTAMAAAYVAAQKPADILFLVSMAFSLAASAFFPVLVLGIFWRRANHVGALAGMISGVGITVYYMVQTQSWLYQMFHGTVASAQMLKANQWWDIAPISAGVWGVPVGFAVHVLVSLLTPAPKSDVQDFITQLRDPSHDHKRHPKHPNTEQHTSLVG